MTCVCLSVKIKWTHSVKVAATRSSLLHSSCFYSLLLPDAFIIHAALCAPVPNFVLGAVVQIINRPVTPLSLNLYLRQMIFPNLLLFFSPSSFKLKAKNAFVCLCCFFLPSLGRVGDLCEECFCGFLGCAVVPQCLSAPLSPLLSHSGSPLYCARSVLCPAVCSAGSSRRSRPGVYWSFTQTVPASLIMRKQGQTLVWSNPTAQDSLLLLLGHFQ